MYYFAGSFYTGVFAQPFPHTLRLQYQRPPVMDIHHSLITPGRHDDKSLVAMLLIKGRFADRREEKRLP